VLTEGKNEKKVPFYLSVILLLWALTATIYATAMAATNFSVKTPFVADFFATESDLKVEAMNFHFNTVTNRFDNVTVDIKNYDDGQAHSGTVFVVLYSADNTQIATGSVGTGMISPGVRLAVICQLMWTSGYTVTDFNHGKITVTQTS